MASLFAAVLTTSLIYPVELFFQSIIPLYTAKATARKTWDNKQVNYTIAVNPVGISPYFSWKGKGDVILIT